MSVSQPTVVAAAVDDMAPNRSEGHPGAVTSEAADDIIIKGLKRRKLRGGRFESQADDQVLHELDRNELVHKKQRGILKTSEKPAVQPKIVAKRSVQFTVNIVVLIEHKSEQTVPSSPPPKSTCATYDDEENEESAAGIFDASAAPRRGAGIFDASAPAAATTSLAAMGSLTGSPPTGLHEWCSVCLSPTLSGEAYVFCGVIMCPKRYCVGCSVALNRKCSKCGVRDLCSDCTTDICGPCEIFNN
jgi:hypothetical protein